VAGHQTQTDSHGLATLSNELLLANAQPVTPSSYFVILSQPASGSRLNSLDLIARCIPRVPKMTPIVFLHHFRNL